MKESNHTIDKKVQKLLALLLGIYQKGVVKEVILGYEPADDDMMILRVARKQIEMLNENVFNSFGIEFAPPTIDFQGNLNE